MRARLGSLALFCAIAIVFVLELVKDAVGNDDALLALGALPDSGQLHGEYWRLVTFGFLHSNLTHVLLNTALLLCVGPVAERFAGTAGVLGVFLSASVLSGICILCKHLLRPSPGASVGASGGLFGILGAALILEFRSSSARPAIRALLIVVLAVGLTYSFAPGISMVGHLSGLIVGATVALFVPRTASTAADG